MERLFTNNETKVEFTFFIVCFNLATKRKTPKDLFKAMDKDKSGSAKINELNNAIKEVIGIQLSEYEIRNIYTFLDLNETEEIEQDELMERIFYVTKKFKDKNSQLCTKASFLIAIADEYDQKRLRDFELLQKMFTESDQDCSGILELSKFNELCQKLDPSLDSGKVKQIFEEALRITKSPLPNRMTPAAFAVIIMKHNVGGYGSGVSNLQHL